MIHFIYRWRDPRIPSNILSTKYVGMTNNPGARFEQHMRCDGNNQDANACMRELDTLGMKPIFEILEVVLEGRDATFRREKHWINYYLKEGCNLFNILIGADAPKEPEDSSHDDYFDACAFTLLNDIGTESDDELSLDDKETAIDLLVLGLKLTGKFDEECVSEWYRRQFDRDGILEGCIPSFENHYY